MSHKFCINITNAYSVAQTCVFDYSLFIIVEYKESLCFRRNFRISRKHRIIIVEIIILTVPRNMGNYIFNIKSEYSSYFTTRIITAIPFSRHVTLKSL